MYYIGKNSFKSQDKVNEELKGKNKIDYKHYENNQLIKEVAAYDIKVVNAHAFENCHNLESIYFGPNIEKIGSKSFSNCSSLKDVWFPMLDRNKRVDIAEDAFVGCGKICFHIFGLGHKTCGNNDIEEYAKRHNFELMGMI